MKQLFIQSISIVLLAIIFAVVRQYFFGSEDSIWASISYYLILFTTIELVRCWFRYRNRKNRKKMNMTESEEEKAVLDSLASQIKPFKSDEDDSQNVRL